MIVDFQIIPHDKQRYETVGDYWWESQPNDDGSYAGLVGRDASDEGHRWVLYVRVSKMNNPRYEMLVFHHELIEALLLRDAGIPEPAAMAWDKEYEIARRVGHLACGCAITEDSEPGNDPHAPYNAQHRVATLCEMALANHLGVNWDAYGREVNRL